jgi:hypothetical protein
VLSLADIRPKPKYLLLEDPRHQGYQSINRKTGFNLNQLKFLLEKLAKFHAATAVLHTDMVSAKSPLYSPLLQIPLIPGGESNEESLPTKHQ